MTDQIDSARELMELPPDDLDYVRQIAAQHNVEVIETPTEGFEPITTVTLVLMGSALAVAAVMALVERHRGGQIIDLRPNAQRSFYRSKDVLYGLVAILHQDGTVSVDVKQPKEFFTDVVESLTSVLGGLGKQSLATVADAALEAVGDRAEVTLQAST